ncbi:tetratricopeptide repeat protein 37 [Culex pipiens pallens]|uniref:tetratricopeptide repeat protein 37 n=1 Tax=Culex pipiens pallens TaxID=42434 RepID=UPI0019539201|nr:tetratricopeptide repeat protein 37 [Culex pipiens pallens]
MSSKELKAALKEAREAVKNKKFSDAIKLCNKILREDKENYMALLLMGASYQETDKKEAASYLKRALEANSDQTVALQGLATCADDRDLPEVCEKLLALTPDKYGDMHGKLLGVASRGEQVEKVLGIFERETSKEGEPDRVRSAFQCLSKVLLADPALEGKHETLVERTLEFEVDNPEDPFLHDKFKRYLKLLYKLKLHEKLVRKACAMHDRFRNDNYPLEWICKVYAEELIDDCSMEKLLTKPLQQYIDAAIEIKSDSALALVASGILNYRSGEMTRAKELLRKADSVQPNWSICLKVLAEVYFREKAFGLAENIYRQLKIVNSNLFVALVEDGSVEKLQEASKYCVDLQKDCDDERFLFYCAKMNLLLGNLGDFDGFMNKLKTLNVSQDRLDYLSALRLKSDGKPQEALEILQKHENSCDCLLELAKLYYETQNVEQSFMAALRATKLDPNNAKCFHWLGKLYLHNADTARARKCLEKCISLNPAQKEAIILLSSLYRTLGEWDANSKLLQSSVALGATGSGSAWAHLQLGLHHLGQQKHDEAIAAFRTVIRYDVANITAWEGLADAYMGRGSYSSAAKVFEKTAELKPENPYPKLQLANIKNILRQHRDAVALFEELLSTNEKYFPAVKGIAESYAGLCYYRLGQRLVGKARDHAQSAVDYVTRAIKLKPNFVCLWKLLANVLDTVAEFPRPRSHLLIEGGLAGVAHRKNALLEGEKLFELASRCYSRAIKINGDDSLLWYELALNHYRRATRFGTVREESVKKLSSAVEAAKQAIKLEPSRWQNWNLLGVICANKEINNLALAQHCFIEAISVDKKTAAVGWSNLGVMYLLQGSIGLANKAFGRAQQTDTTCINAWIGQASIAEQMGHGEEAMDLFRHCTQLGYHPESALSYAHWVCSVLSEEDYSKNKRNQFAIENMHALPLSHDSIQWHCIDKHDEASVEALSFLGNISSRLGLWATACEAYRKAAAKANGQQKDHILCDLGQCLLKRKLYSEAVECFQQVSEATYQATVGKALAYFKAGQYQESYAEYEGALNWLATSDLEKAYVLIAMSAMVYAFQGEADAKTILFQCITLPEPPIEALFSACALGLLHKDAVLTELVIKELRKYEDDPKHGHHVVYLVSQFYWANKQKSQSLAYLVSQVHKWPARAKLRQVLAISLLKNHRTPKQNLIVASGIAQSALVLDLHDRQGSTRAEDAAKWLAVASEAVRPVDERRRRVLAQKAVHVDPTCREAWSSLIRVLQAKK